MVPLFSHKQGLSIWRRQTGSEIIQILLERASMAAPVHLMCLIQVSGSGFLWVSVNYSIRNCHFFLFFDWITHWSIYHGYFFNLCLWSLIFPLTDYEQMQGLECVLSYSASCGRCVDSFSEQSASCLPPQPLCLQSEAWLSLTDLNFELLLFCCIHH